MDLVKLLLVTTLASLIPGQLIRIPIGSVLTLTASDITTTILIIFFIAHSLAIKNKINLPTSIFTPFLVFSLVALVSTILATTKFTPSQILSAFFFQLRFTLYFLIFVVVLNIVKKEQITNWLNITIIITTLVTFIGFLQFILIPDLSFLIIYGWDPHQKRLVSTFLDPNFMGGVLTVLTSISISIFLYKKKYIYLLAAAIATTGVILTLSRSSYLALLVCLIIIGILKSPKFLLSFLIVFILVLAANTQSRQRIIGAFTIDETAQARIESYRRALKIWGENPILGVGFNTYRYVQSQYGFFTLDDPLGGHSGAGSDSSFLFVGATTGIIGAFAFTLLILSTIRSLLQKKYKNYVKLAALSSFCAILVHSQFVNSFFYPQIMILVWFLLGLAQVSDNESH